MNTNLKNIISKEKWLSRDENPFTIAGPCSAESEEQVHKTVHQIAKLNVGVKLLRAGIWKPRTRPYTFEGVGEKGIQWLKSAGKSAGLPITIEVANAKHVQLALQNEIDVLWIGARTTVSPFIVQEISEALTGVNVPVLVKNPVNPDIELWIGAMERLNKAGITKLAAIHRGFSTYEKTEYRNRPSWEIPIELRRRIPEIPIICDPSHICGRRDTLQSVAQKAMDLNFEGLMIETHITPESALSDKNQQLTPQGLKDLLESLIIRRSKVFEPLEHQALTELRQKIDRIDSYIFELLAERMGIVEEIGDYKREQGITILQVERWAEVVDRCLKIGKDSGLTEDFIKKLLEQVHKESINHQEKVMNEETQNE